MLLSILLPGLGQLYLNEKPKGISILCITVGAPMATAVTTWVMDHSFSKFFSWGTLFILGFIYFLVMIPAATEAFQAASGKARIFNGDSIPYVLVMLFIFAGPFAVPLLWQSSKFSRSAKVICTILVTVVVLVAILILILFRPMFDEIMKQNSSVIIF